MSAAYPFVLQPHPGARPSLTLGVTGRIERDRDGVLRVTYFIDGDLTRINCPPQQGADFADDLWRHTCCELFIAQKAATEYYEFNFSPSCAWAIYRFVRTRERASGKLDAATLDPHIVVRRDAARCELQATVRLGQLAPAYAGANLMLGVSAVIEDDTGALSYWALRHPLEKPDFHHPQAFALELDEVRH